MFAMKALFDKHGLRFHYPKDWTLEDHTDDPECAEVTVSNDDTAFWTVSIHDRSFDPEALMSAAIEAVSLEYEGVETQSFDAHAKGDELCGDDELYGCDLHFCYLDLINTACFRAFKTPEACCLVMYQAEDREFEEVQAVMEAMTASLYRGGA